MLSNNRYKSQRRDLIQTQGADDILVSGGIAGTTGKYMIAAKPGLITQRQTGGRYSPEQVLDGLIGWWFLAEPLGTGTYYDFSGSDATITVASGTVTTEYTGIYGPVPRIDYLSGYLAVSGATALGKFAPLTNASWTITTWVRFDNLPSTGRGAILDVSENLVDTGKSFVVFRDTSSGVITYSLFGTATSISTTTVPVVGRWYHLALIYEYSPTSGNGSLRIYLDGTLENTANSALPFAGNLANGGSLFRVGYIATSAAYLGGALNDFRIYRRSLSSTEVGYLVGLRNGKLAPGLQSYSGNTTQTTRWQSGPINTNQIGPYITEIGQSTDGTPFTGSSQILQPGAYALRGHWPLSGDNTTFFPDISGNQAPGSMATAGTQIGNPEIGTMLALNGSTDYVDMSAYASKINFVNTGSFTICMWVKLNNEISTSSDPFFELGTSTIPTATGSHIYAYRGVSTNTITFTFYNNQLMSQVAIDNSLTHLAFTYNRQTRTRQIWVNGQIAGQDTNVNPPLLTSLTRFRIGYNITPSALFLSGQVADFRIYSTAITGPEINQIIRQRLTPLGLEKRGLLVATRLTMPFNEPQTVGTTLSNIQDQSGYGHLGTSTGAQQIISIGAKSGLSFTSSASQRVTIQTTSALSITGALSISFWIYPTNLATQFTVISKQVYGEYDIVINTNGSIQFSHGSGTLGISTAYTTTNSIITATNQWYYITITRDTGAATGKNVHIWANGIYNSLTKLGANETTYTVGTASSNVFIGSTTSGTGYANMILSGLEVCAICWTPNEIRARMLQSQPQNNGISQNLGIISSGTADNLALHLNSKDAVAVLGASPQYLPDYSGYGHTANVQPTTGAVSFSAVSTLPGGAARSLLFNGTTGYLVCDGGVNGREYLGPAGGTARTISMWVNPSSLSGAGRPLISWGSANTVTTTGTGAFGAFDAYLNSSGNLVVNLNSQADLVMTRTWDTRLSTGSWQYLTLVVDPSSQPSDMIKCYTGNSTSAPSAANLVAESSNTNPTQLVCLLDLADETPNGRLTDSSGYGNHATYTGQRWGSLTNITTGRLGHGQVELSGLIYIIGGIITGSAYSTSVETFNGSVWSAGTALGTAKAYFGCAIYNSSIYAVGGLLSGGSSTTGVAFSTGGSWSSATALSTSRGECVAATLGDYLYAMGGYTTGPTTYLSSVERFNGSSWATTTSMNTARASPAIAILAGYIYVMGGYNSTDFYLRTVERFDGSSWTFMPPMNYPRYGASAVSLGGYIYIMGGTTTGGTILNSVERFDGLRWTVIGPLPTTLTFAAASPYTAGNYLMLTGGSTNGATNSPVNTAYRAIKSTGLWGEPVTWMNAASSNIIIPASTTTNLAANSAHTVSIWIQPSVTTSGTLFSAENTSSQDLCAIRINASGRVVYTMTNASSITNTVSSNSALTANTWTQVITTYDGSNMRLFLDGVLTNTTASSGTTISGTPRDIYIGADWNTAAKDYYSGNLGECRLYQTTLSSNSVGALYGIGTQMINRSQVRTQPSAQLCIGRGFTGSLQATNYYSGYMDDIRVYDGLALSYPDMVSVWSNGAGNYYTGTAWRQPNPNDLSANSSGVIISAAPIPRQLANQTYYTATFTSGGGTLSYKGPGQEFLSGSTWDLNAKLLTYTPNTTATGYTWSVATGTSWTSGPFTYSPNSNSSISGDDTFGTAPLTTPFRYYGTNYSTVYVSTNGYLSMTTSNAASFDVSYDALYRDPIIAGFRRDLNVTGGGTLNYGIGNSSLSSLNDTFIATWLNVPNYSGGGVNNLQIILFLNNAPSSLAGNVIVNYGSSALIANSVIAGISNGGGSTPYINDGQGVDLSAGPNVAADVYTLTAATSNLATRPSNITPTNLLSQSMTCANLVITNPLVQPYNLTSNLAGWWQLNDLPASGTSNTLADSSGLGHTATKTGPGQALWLVSPQNHPAIYLNGVQQQITIKDGTAATFPVSGSDYSISGWFNCFSNTSGANNAIIGISTNADADRLVVYSAPDSNLIVSTSAANTTGTIPATGNAWNHLVITGTGTDALGSNTRVYLNNYQIANTSATTTFATNDKFYLGSKRTTASGGTNTNYYTGLLSDFRIYNRRLQPSEIGQIYQGGNHGVMQTDTGSGVYSLACVGTPGIGSSTNSRLIKLVSPGFAQVPATPREPQQGSLGISARVKIDGAQPSIGTIASSESAGVAGSWQLLTAPPELQALKLWFALNDGVSAGTAYNGAHTSPAYNGSYTGSGFSWSLASRSGVAPVFNGSSNYITVDNGSGLNADTLVGADITICCWVNVNSSALGTRTVFGISESGTGATVLGLTLVGANNTLTATIGAQTVTSNGQAATNSWCFVALTIRAGIYVSLYLNNGGRGIGTPPAPYGADYYTATLVTPLAIGDTNMIYIGAQPGSPSATNYFSGGLADIRVYNKSLEPGEIELCYYNRMLPYFIINTTAATPKVLAVGQIGLDADKWHHISVNYSASGRIGKLSCAEIWVNGRFAGDGNLADLDFVPTTSAGLAANTTANIIIGSSILSAGENPRSYLQGKVDDLRISRQPFDPSVIQSSASGWQDCVLAVGSVGLGGTSNSSGLGVSSSSSTTTSAPIGVAGAGVLVDISSGYGSERRDYANQISAFGGVQVLEDRLLGTQLIFNGATSYCAIGGYLAQAYHRIFAISLWITPDATLATGTDAQIFAKWTGSADGSSCYKLAYNFIANTITASVGIGSRTVSVSASCRRALTHVLFQTTSTELHLYINGTIAGMAQLATTAGASAIINISNNTAVRIGSGSYGQAGTFFKGSVAGLRVFETILPSGTISELASGRDLSAVSGSSASIASYPTTGYDSSRRPQINSGLVFWLSNPQLDLVGGNIASIAGTSIPQIRVSENSIYRARGIASNCTVLSAGSSAVASLGTGIQTLGSVNSNLIFDGSDVLAQLSGSQSFSVAFWGKFFNSIPASNETVLSIRDPGATTANTMIEISRDSTTKAVAMNFGTGTATETSNSLVVADTNWHHWVITYGANSSVSNTAVAASKRNYYLDGVRVGFSPSSNIGRPMLSNCGVLALGTDFYSSGTAANIGLQDFRIYNRVLGVDEVALLYNMPLANSVVGGSTPIELQPSSGGTSGYEVIGLRKRLVSPAGIPVSGVSGDTAAGDIIDVVGAGSGAARDNLVCAVGANPSNSTVVADQNWQVKPLSNYRSPGYLSNAIIPSVAGGFVLGGGATSNTVLGLNGSPAVINLGNSTGNLYFGTSNLIIESRDWSVCFSVSAAGSAFSNSALMTFQGASAVSYRSWWLNSSNAGELMFQVDSSGTANGTGVFLPSDGTWTHLAITKGQLVDGVSATANTVCVYQDGICRWQRVVGLNPSGPQNITFGSVPGLLSSAGFGGRLRDIQVYNSCLPAGVIRNLAVQSNQLMGGSATRPTGAPLHHWLFAMATSSNTVPDLGVLGSALGLSATGVSIQYRNQGNSLETWSRVAMPGLPSDGVGYFTGAGEAVAYSCPVVRDGAMTVAFWMRRSAIGILGEGLVTWGTGSVSGGWFAIGLNSSGQISVRTSSTMTPRVVSTTAITDNRWYHVCVVCLPSSNSTTGGIGNANNIRIFINGCHDTLAPFGTGFETSTINISKSSSSSSDWLYVGSYGALNYFSGWMDDLRVYNYALTPDEVLGLTKGASQLAVVRR
jgi:N-acetylneuraminic acid mutarotase